MPDEGRIAVRLREEIRSRREAAGVRQWELAKRVYCSNGHLCHVEKGRTFPSEGFVALVDEALAAGGALVDLHSRAVQERHAAKLGLPALPEQEEDATDADRRNLLRLGTLAAAAATAADISRRIAGADPDPLTLDELEAGIDQIAATYTTREYNDLVPSLVTGWTDAEARLDSRVWGGVRRRLSLVAGQYTYYLARAAGQNNDDTSERKFLALALQHAEEVGDLLLAGSVAVQRAGMAYGAGRYTVAADIAAAARERAHPYVAPYLAACEAEAAAAAGRPDAARRALRDMQESLWVGEVMPGPAILDEEAAHYFTAAVHGLLGDGVAAEPHARASLEMIRGTGQFLQIGYSWNNLGRAFLCRPAPDPERAAAAINEALTVTAGHAAGGVVRGAGQKSRDMNRRWPELKAVRELGEAVDTARRALPPGKNV
jgi:transcriptional regulator with XRE-family HTH domain